MKRYTTLGKKELRAGIIFIFPWLVGFLCFTLYPFFASLYYSFTSYSVLRPPRWVGLENYSTLIFKDEIFKISLYNTFYYVIFAVPLSIVFGVAVALLLNMKVRGMAIYRTIFYLPNIVPIVASAILWKWILNPQYGLLNALLSYLGLEGPGWLSDPLWSKPALIIMSLWMVGGPMLIYLASLQGIPQNLYEVAELDGANSCQKMIHVTLPMIGPAIFFNLIMGLIGGFQYFTQAYVMTGGGPVDSTLFYSLYLYRNAFRFFKMGYASTMGWILFLIILGVTLAVFRFVGRRIYYGGTKL